MRCKRYCAYMGKKMRVIPLPVSKLPYAMFARLVEMIRAHAVVAKNIKSATVRIDSGYRVFAIRIPICYSFIEG